MAKGKKITSDVQRSADEQIDAAERAKRPPGVESGIALREADGSLQGLSTPAGRLQAEIEMNREPELSEDAKELQADALAIIDEYERASRDGRGLSRDDVVEMRRRVASL